MDSTYHVCQPEQTNPNQYALSQVLDAKLEDFLISNPKLPAHKKSKLQNLLRCYRREFGYAVYQCDSCEVAHFLPATCGSTICPKCSYHRRQAWLSCRKLAMPPISYFHNVFTVPHELNEFFLRNQKLAFTALFNAVEKTIKWAIERKGGPESEGLFTLVLHTWNKKLLPHFHIHALIGAGYLKNGIWHQTDPKYFCEIKKLSAQYKEYLQNELLNLAQSGEAAKISKYETYLEYLKKNGVPPMTRTGKAKPRPGTPIYPVSEASLNQLDETLNTLVDKPFKCHVEHVRGGHEKVLEYLSAYTHKVGIADNRIHLNQEEQSVDIQVARSNVKGRPAPGPKKITLTYEEFLGRYVTHILPPNFRRVRHYGVLQGPKSKQKIKQVLMSLKDENEITEQNHLYDIIVLGKQDLDVEALKIPCPSCKNGTLEHIHTERKSGYSFDALIKKPDSILGILKNLGLTKSEMHPIPQSHSPPTQPKELNL